MMMCVSKHLRMPFVMRSTRRFLQRIARKRCSNFVALKERDKLQRVIPLVGTPRARVMDVIATAMGTFEMLVVIAHWRGTKKKWPQLS